MLTGTVIEGGLDFGGFVSFEDDTTLIDGLSAHDRREASDPRLSGTSTCTGS